MFDTSNDFSLATDIQTNRITIDGESVVGLIQKVEIFENLYMPVIFGTIVLLDSDSVNFIANHDIQGVEDIEFEFTSAKDEVLEFKGKLNGVRNKTSAQGKIIYAIDFTAEQLRKNEGSLVTQRYKNQTPGEVCQDLIEEKLEGEIDTAFFDGEGLPMNFLGCNKRPTECIKYAITKGVPNNNSEVTGAEKDEKKGEAKGTSGYLCWQTLDGYRMMSIDKIKAGNGGNNAGEFIRRLQQHGLSLEESVNSIIDYEFKELGDFQAKLRSGAFKTKNVFINIDTGQYQELLMEADNQMTWKDKEQLDHIPFTVVTSTILESEIYELMCEKANDVDYWDPERKSLAQNAVNQNTFDDQTGSFTLAPQFTMRAGDTFDAKIPNVEVEKGPGYDEKTTGRYICKGVSHHIFFDAQPAGYTKITTVRTTVQQDDASSRATASATGRGIGQNILNRIGAVQ